MNKFFESYDHFFFSVVKKAKEKTKKPVVDRAVKMILNDTYKYDETFKPIQSLCSKLYFDVFYSETLTNQEFISMLKKYHNLVKPYKETDLWKESDIVYTIDIPKTKEFEQLMETSKHNYGIYFLYDNNKEIIYIGKSISNLSHRSLESAIDKKAQYMQHYYTRTKADADIYELYFISKYKPLYNRDCKEEDNISFTPPDLRCSEIVKIYLARVR